MHRRNLLPALLTVVLASVCLAATGCHTAHQCPILQGMADGAIPAPLPPKGAAYYVVGNRPGIRFPVIQYSDKLYRGGNIHSAEGYETLKKLGVKTIVSVTPTAREREMAQQHGMKLVEIPFGWYTLAKADLDRFLTVVDVGPTPIFVHSFLGINRAAILLAYYRIRREGWTVDRALGEYFRLDANYWDSLEMVKVLKEAAAAPASGT